MSLRLLLVRHGETVDNIASVIAGVRDSPLTNHGFQQAVRLGQFLNATGVDITHVFASPLQRAFMTAEQILTAQPAHVRNQTSVVPIPSLKEQNFGLFEGATYREYSPQDPRHDSVESKDMMATRANDFIRSSLTPLLESSTSTTAVIVSHGIMLQTLWSQILELLRPSHVACDQQLLIQSRSIDHRRIGAWSNTAFLDVTFTSSPSSSTTTQVPPAVTSAANARLAEQEMFKSQSLVRQRALSAQISAINARPHLDGFKRTRGGVGSSQYDARQSTLDRFFISSGPN